MSIIIKAAMRPNVQFVQSYGRYDEKTNLFVFKCVRRLRPVRYRSHRTPRRQVWIRQIVQLRSVFISDLLFQVGVQYIFKGVYHKDINNYNNLQVYVFLGGGGGNTPGHPLEINTGYTVLLYHLYLYFRRVGRVVLCLTHSTDIRWTRHYGLGLLKHISCGA